MMGANDEVGWRRAWMLARRQRWMVIGAGALVAVIVAFPMTSAAGPGPYARAKVKCERSATAGGSMTVSGKRFPADAAVVISFDEPPATASTTTSSTGQFSAVLQVPHAATAGRHRITVTATADPTSVVRICAVRVRT